MLHKERLLSFISFFFVSLFITWYVVFESPYLASKIDTHIHLFRVQNLLDALKSGILFPSWHDSPYWGYPEDFNFYLSYLFLMVTGLVLPIVWAFKLFYFVFFFLAGLTSEWCFRKILSDKHSSFVAALLYMGSASFANFALGSGSPPRVAAIVFFPLMIGSFIQFWKNPNRRNAALFCLSFFVAYMAHPIAALAGCLTLAFSPLLMKPHGNYKSILKNTWPVFLLGALCFSWYLVELLYMKKALSWDDVYKFYAQFRVNFSIKSFFFFWMNNAERTQQFYMGSFPLLFSLLAPFFILKKSKLDQSFRYFFCLTLFSFLIILFGQDLFQRNTFRLDLIFNFALSGMTAYLMSFIKWKKTVLIVVALIIVDQTYFFRRFGGMSYIGDELVTKFKHTYGEKITQKRLLIDEEQPHMVITPKQYERLSGSDWIEFHGVLEITPYNLGLIPFIKTIGQYESLYQHLGIARSHLPELPQLQKFSHYQLAEARSRKEAWDGLYLPQLESPHYFSHLSPIVYLQQEIETPRLVDSTTRPLTLIREAFHPRRKVLTQEGEIAIFPVEPGLIGTYSTVQNFKVTSQFLYIEMFAGFLTLLSVGFLATLLVFKKRFLS